MEVLFKRWTTGTMPAAAKHSMVLLEENKQLKKDYGHTKLES